MSYLAKDRDDLPSNKEAGVEGSDDEPPLIGTNQIEPDSETENLLRESNAGDRPETTPVSIGEEDCLREEFLHHLQQKKGKLVMSEL